MVQLFTQPNFYNEKLNENERSNEKKAGTKVGPDQLGPPVRVGSTRIDSYQLGSNENIKIK